LSLQDIDADISFYENEIPNLKSLILAKNSGMLTVASDAARGFQVEKNLALVKRYENDIIEINEKIIKFEKELQTKKELQNNIRLGIIPQIFEYNYSSKFGTFTTQAETEPQAYQMFQTWLKQKEIETQPEPTPEPIPEPIPEPTPEPVPIETPLVTEPEPVIIEQPIITATPIIAPTVDDSISTGMVTQQVINFNIINGRAVGSIKFVATNNFNPYYYGKNILSIVKFKTPNGVNILPYVKQNNLRFTETERDEVINFDEDMKGNTRATVESFVWEWIDKPLGAFSKMFSIQISETETAKPLSTGIMGAGVGGAIGILILLGFVADKWKK